MRHLPACVAALLLALLLFGPGPRAQEVAEPEQARELSDAADAARDAITAGDHDALFDELAKWRQEKMGLLNEKLRLALKEEPLDDPKYAEALMGRLRQLDPDGALELKTPQDLYELTDAEFLGLCFGVIAVGREITADKPVWLQTELSEGLIAPRRSRRATEIIRWGGTVVYETADGLKLSMEFSRQGNDWKLYKYTLSESVYELEFERFLKEGAYYDVKWPGVDPARQPDRSAEQLLKSARGRARIQYAKLGGAPEKLSECVEDIEEYSSDQYRVRDEILKLKGSERDASMIAEPKADGNPWVVMHFDWVSGKTDFETYPSEEAMNQRLEELRGEETDEPEDREEPERKFR